MNANPGYQLLDEDLRNRTKELYKHNEWIVSGGMLTVRSDSGEDSLAYSLRPIDENSAELIFVNYANDLPMTIRRTEKGFCTKIGTYWIPGDKVWGEHNYVDCYRPHGR